MTHGPIFDRSRLLPTSLLASLLVLAGTPAFSDDFIWEGEADSSWHNPLNWNPNEVPDLLDNAIFGPLSSVDCEIGQDVAVFDLHMQAGFEGTISTVVSGLTVQIDGDLTIADGTLTGSPTLTAQGTTRVLGGTFSLTRNPTFYGPVELLGGVVSFLSDNVGIANSTILIDGADVTWQRINVSDTFSVLSGSFTTCCNAAFYQGDVEFQGGTIDFGGVDQLFRGDLLISPAASIVGATVRAHFDGSGPQVLAPSGVEFRAVLVEGSALTILGDVVAQRYEQSSGTCVLDGLLQIQPGGEFRVLAGTQLEVAPAGVVDATLAGIYEVAGTILESGVIRRLATGIGFTDALGNPVVDVPVGVDLYVTLFDEDENVDGSLPNLANGVMIESTVTGDLETYVLEETGNSSETFRNSLGFPTAGGAAVLGDGVLQHDGSENLLVTYLDQEDPADLVTRSLDAPPIVWDGGGSDTSWFTPENWDGDTVPTLFDRVLFDGTSSLDCTIDQNASVYQIEIAPGYSGAVVTQSSLFLEVGSDLTISDGSLLGSATINVRGTTRVLGGTFSLTRNPTFYGPVELLGGVVSFLSDNVGIANSTILIDGADVTWQRINVSDTFSVLSGSFTTCCNAAFYQGDVEFQGGTIDFGGVDQLFRGDLLISPAASIVGATVRAHFDGSGPQVLAPSGVEFRAVLVEGSALTILGDVVAQRYEQSSGTCVLDGLLQIQPGGEFRVLAGTQLEVAPAGVVDATLAGIYEVAGTILESGVIRRLATGIGFTDALGNPVVDVPVGVDLYVTLFDEDENVDGSLPNLANGVMIESTVTGDLETYVLEETGNSSETFRNSLGFPTAGGAAVLGDGVLQHDGSENLLVTYLDQEDPADLVTRSLDAPPIVWDGGGSDTSWFTPENWDGDTVPTLFDRVLFDGTSSLDCTIDQNASVYQIEIAPGYSGAVVTQSSLFLEVGSDLTISDGSLLGSATINVRGTTRVLGGTFSLTRNPTFYGPVELLGGVVSFLSDNVGIANSTILIDGADVTWQRINVSDTFSVLSGSFTTCCNAAFYQGDVEFQGGTIDFGGVDQLFRGDLLISPAASIVGATVRAHFDGSGPQVLAPSGVEFRAVLVEGSALTILGDVVAQRYEQSSGTCVLDGLLQIQPGGEFRVLAGTQLEVAPAGVVDATLAGIYEVAGTILESGVIRRTCFGVGPTDEAGDPIAVVTIGAPLSVTASDEDANLVGSALDVVTVEIFNVANGDNEFVVLTETSPASGLFRNDRVPTFEGTATLGNGIVEAIQGQRLTFTYRDSADISDVCVDGGLVTILDCNGNGVEDAQDIALGTSADLNENGIPDECEQAFVRGDVTANGSMDLADVIALLAVLFEQTDALSCDAAADLNDDESIDLADPLFGLAYLFDGGPDPSGPFPRCGIDPTSGLQACFGFDVCP